MRKFTLFIASLFLSFGTLAAQDVYVTDLNNLSNDKVYFLESARCFLMKSDNVDGLATSNGKSPSAEEKVKDYTNENQQFKIEKDGDNYYLYSVGATKYVSNSGSWSDTKTNALTFENVGGDYPWKLCIGGNGLNSQDPGQTDSGIMVNGWTITDAGNCYKILDIAAATVAEVVNVKYIFTYGGDEKFTQTTTDVYNNSAYPAISITLPYGVTATAPTGNVNAEDAEDGVIEIEIPLTVNLPFIPAESYDTIEHWYYMIFHANSNNYLYYDADLTYLDANQTAVDKENKDAYTWAFVGDPFNGFQIVNYAAGSTKVLSSAAEPTADKEYPVMTEITAITGNKTWDLTNSTYGTNGFYVAYAGTTKRLNKQDGKVCYWLAGADAGSTFMVQERPMGPVAELEALVAEIEAANITSGTTVGYYTVASVAELNAAVANAKKIVEAESATENDVTVLQAAYDALKIVLPEAGKFYNIVSSCTVDSRAGQKIYVNADGYMHFQNAETMTEVFQFVPAGDDTFYLYSVQRGTYLNTAKGHAGGQHTALATTTENAVKVTISNLGSENIVEIVPEGGAMIHAQAASAAVVGWNAAENVTVSASAWKIEEVADITALSHSVTVGEAGYATLYLNYAVTIPEGVEVYGVNSVESSWVTMDAITGVIPAKTAVILKNEGEYAFNYTSETSDATSLLKGTLLTENVTPAGTAYVLSAPNGAESVGLYQAVLSEGTFLNNANKVFLDVTTTNSAASYSFNFDWAGTTGIEGVAAEGAQDGVIYDITGRRVKAITAPGIYIVNGRKVVK